jgi:neutral ceramidase
MRNTVYHITRSPAAPCVNETGNTFQEMTIMNHLLRRIVHITLTVYLTSTGFVLGADGPDDYTFKVESNLRASVAKIDISPAEDTPVTGHIRPTKGFRDRLHAVILLLDDGRTKAALVTHDLIACSPAVVDGFRDAVADAAGIPRENVMVAASHNHSGPKWEDQPAWSRQVMRDTGVAVTKAMKELRPVSIGYGVDRIDFNINRRMMIEGRSVVRLNPEGPCDKRVKVLRFDDGLSLDPVAVLMHVVCHPCVLTWGDKWSAPYPEGYPKKSADFPGEAKSFVEKVYGTRTKALFLQGCAGDIRPNLPGFPYRCGDEADMRWIGRGLGSAVIRASDHSAIREERAKRPAIYPVRCASRVVELPSKTEGEKVRCELQAMKVGPWLFLTLPGEPMVEFGFRLEKAIADRAIPIVVGYANGNIGYICTAKAHQEGGYEPKYSASGPGAEEILIRESLRLADQVIADVFENFAPVKPKLP